MSKFNQLAKSDKPLLFLSADSTTDQSGNNHALLNNNLQATGQPIIYENLNSFFVDDTHGVDIPGNQVFFSNNATIEFVALFFKPLEATRILVDSNLNGLYLDENGLYFTFLDTNGLTTMSIDIDNWHIKHYVKLEFLDRNVTLTLDGNNASLETSLTAQQDTLNLICDVGNKFLLDGFGMYTRYTLGRDQAINDPGTGHAFYASRVLAGIETRFQPYEKHTLNLTKDNFDYDSDFNVFYYNYLIPQETFDQILHVTTDIKGEVNYTIDYFGIEGFTEELLIDVTDKQVFNAIVDGSQTAFNIKIEFIARQTVEQDTPATIDFSGLANFIDIEDSSIVNCGRGLQLDGISATGESMIPMETIEIVFKPGSSTETILFSNADCEISYGSAGAITTTTIYLNGVLVTDLMDVLIDQWNHIVIIPDAHVDTSFMLNENLQFVELKSLSIYPTELSATTIEKLYDIVAGKNELSVVEVPTVFTEVDFEGQNVNLYSNSWAIVSAGGR